MENNEVILLNVGGFIYYTTRATLVKYPNSTLGLMMNGDTPISRDQNGIFIDRDGQMFRYILNFCRSGKLCLPQQFSDYDLLENEAEFYQIEPLVTSIKSSRQQAMKENQGFNYIEIVEEKSYSIPQSRNFVVSSKNAFPSTCSTSVYGRIDDLTALPPECVYISGDLQTDLVSNYGKLTIEKGDVRLQIGEFLSKRGWVKEYGDSYSSTNVRPTNEIVKEQTYRDVWKICKKK
ncbi:BTB/POZ domain-containing protein KCTD6-like [Saccostrea cucullata]|uniref:BTB/POZ domain-containing protein KCTD6-like n=1 Tax=Saccostrea cuccullata TaxID=36930 RepID=UPI002ED15B78